MNLENSVILSFVIPIYNAEKKIERCISSLHEIQNPYVEFVLVNDGSTDNSLKMCRQYAEMDRRFVIFDQTNSGSSAARNKGLELSRGKYIAFVDADDYIQSHEYEAIIHQLKDCNYDWIAFDFTIIEKGELLLQRQDFLQEGDNPKEVVFESFIHGNANSVFSHIYSADIIRINDIRFPEDIKMGEDAFFNARYIQVASTFLYMSVLPYVYDNDNDFSITHTMKLDYLQDYIKLYDMLINLISKMGLETKCNLDYYLSSVYQILRKEGYQMTKEKEKSWERSNLYKDLISNSFIGWNRKCIQFFIKNRLYKWLHW